MARAILATDLISLVGRRVRMKEKSDGLLSMNAFQRRATVIPRARLETNPWLGKWIALNVEFG